jgi:hypothetical protein
LALAAHTHPAPSEPLLRSQGIYTAPLLGEIANSKREWRVDSYLARGSVNLLVGDSGLGKTALAILLGLAVATGRPFLGRATTKGRVLFCDAESGAADLHDMINALSKFLELDGPPDDFRVWSPNLDPTPPPPPDPEAKQSGEIGDVLVERVKLYRPDLVICDPLRAFWPDAERDSTEGVKLVRLMRLVTKDVGCEWLANHHRRKRDLKNPVTLVRDRNAWFEEAAGTLALVNQTDTRLGIEAASGGVADLVLGGFVRGRGWTGVQHLVRVFDDDGEPLGYRVTTGADLLPENYRAALVKLPDAFRFRDAKAALGGNSDSNTTNLLKECISAGLVKKQPGGHYSRTQECVERTE